MDLLKRAEKREGKFSNPVSTELGGLGLALKVIPRMLFYREERTPARPVGPFETPTAAFAERPAGGLRVTWFGHSSLLVEMDGFRILIDPVWEQRAGPVEWAGPKRFWPPTMQLEELPPLDAILISHDHYDHMGARTLRKLATLPNTDRTRWVTSLGVGRRLRKLGVAAERTHELDWTESVRVDGNGGVAALIVTAWPARHFSGRGVRDRFQTLWSSFVIEGPEHRVYFGADSGWWEGFAEIAGRYNGFDLTILEIGAFDPLWAGIHLGPDGALRAYRAMGGPAKAGLLMPIHWGLFSLGLHGWRQPMERLQAIAEDAPIFSPRPGIPTLVDGPGVDTWWKS